MKFAVVGALTIDLYGDRKLLGGPPWFAGAAASMHHDVKVYSAVGGLDFPESFLQQLRNARVNTSNILKAPNSFSYTFQHEYSHGVRKSRLIKVGPSIPEDSLTDIDADSLLLSPVYREAGENHFKILRKLSPFLALDLQGFLREKDEFGNIFLVGKDLTRLLKSADVVHCSEEEAIVLLGEPDPVQAVKNVAKAVGGVVLVGSTTGLLVAHQNLVSYFKVDIVQREVDPTGAGDMLTALFIDSFYQTHSATEAAASALAYLADLLMKHRETRFTQKIQPRPELVQLVWTKPV